MSWNKVLLLSFFLQSLGIDVVQRFTSNVGKFLFLFSYVHLFHVSSVHIINQGHNYSRALEVLLSA